jgi:Ca-activated chloride channel homolog
MKRNALILLLAAGAAIAWQQSTLPVIPGQPAFPPAPPAEPLEDDYRISSEVDLVLLDVAVKDSRGGFVSGLQKNAFRILDRKQEQPIRIFSAQDVPVTVGLVVDNSGSVRPKKPEIVTAALTFITQSHPKDETFIVNFNDRVYFGLPDDIPFSDDVSLLRQALLTNPARGRTALYDAIKMSLEHLEKGRLDKKTLVLISDGGDNTSETTKDEVMALIERSIATIYTVGIFNPDDKDKNPGFLKDVAALTGGEYYEPGNISHLVGVCEKIAKDIRNRYTLGFAPDTSSFDGKRRNIRVEAVGEDGRKLQARTRTHYIAAPRASRSRSEAK